MAIFQCQNGVPEYIYYVYIFYVFANVMCVGVGKDLKVVLSPPPTHDTMTKFLIFRS